MSEESQRQKPEIPQIPNEPSDALSAIRLKRKHRELILIFVITFLSILALWFEIRLISQSQRLPIIHSLFFFGLVNFNVILLLLLIFLIYRNLGKVFVEKKSRIIGSSLKKKLVLAFTAFSFVPAALIFVTSFFYISASFDKWFSKKVVNTLKSSTEIQNVYFFEARKRNYHFAHTVAENIKSLGTRERINSAIDDMAHDYDLDFVEYYPSLLSERTIGYGEDSTQMVLPPLSIDFLQKGLKSGIEASTIHQFGEGNLIRVMVPVDEKNNRGVIVVSTFIPLSLVSRMNDVTQAYEEFRDINPIEDTLKSIFLTILFLISGVILFSSVWFAYQLADQLAVPLLQLGLATRRIAAGDYTALSVKTGNDEMENLVDSFNQMISNLEKSQLEVRAANQSLQETLSYIEVVLRNVSAGVISVDTHGRITTINRHAAELLKIDPEIFLGNPVRELLTLEYFRTFAELIKTMQDQSLSSIQRELNINVNGEPLPLLLTLSILKNDSGIEIGRILVFDDLTHIMNAQRSAAWSEVARRIAHEIKNPLTPIRLAAERLERKFGATIQDQAFMDCTRMIIQQVEDLRNLVNEFSQYARLPQAKPIEGDLNRAVSQALQMYQESHPEIQFQVSLTQNLPPLRFDHDQIKRVLINLLDNSISAVTETKNPQIEVSSAYDPDYKIARLTLTDNGIGIPADDRLRVFEPYYTTKESGTGLGLAIVKRIIEDHNGSIRCFGHQPRGTKMVIELPLPNNTVWAPGPG